MAKAKNPIICLGGGAHDAVEQIAALTNLLGAPVSALRQGKGAYDERDELYVKRPVAPELWKTVDVTLGIGTRLLWHEMVWGVDVDLKLIQINADLGENNRRGYVNVPIPAMAQHALPLLIEALGKRLGKVEDRRERIAEMNATFHKKIAAELQPKVAQLAVIRDVLGDDGIFVDDLTQVT